MLKNKENLQASITLLRRNTVIRVWLQLDTDNYMGKPAIVDYYSVIAEKKPLKFEHIKLDKIYHF